MKFPGNNSNINLSAIVKTKGTYPDLRGYGSH